MSISSHRGWRRWFWVLTRFQSLWLKLQMLVCHILHLLIWKWNTFKMRYIVKWINHFNLVVVQLWNWAAYVIQDFIATDELQYCAHFAPLNFLDKCSSFEIMCYSDTKLTNAAQTRMRNTVFTILYATTFLELFRAILLASLIAIQQSTYKLTKTISSNNAGSMLM